MVIFPFSLSFFCFETKSVSIFNIYSLSDGTMKGKKDSTMHTKSDKLKLKAVS